MVHVEHFKGNTSRDATVTTTLSPDGDGTQMSVVMR